MFRRTIKLPKSMLLESPRFPGRNTVYPVLVGWPELDLTETQILENALDQMDGKPMRHAPSGLILIEVSNE